MAGALLKSVKYFRQGMRNSGGAQRNKTLAEHSITPLGPPSRFAGRIKPRDRRPTGPAIQHRPNELGYAEPFAGGTTLVHKWTE
jgi:hypothetical protein